MRLFLCTLAVSVALFALNDSRAQERETREADPQSASAESASEASAFEARAAAVRRQDISAAEGALAHAERAEERRATLTAEGREGAAIRAERIALRALELAEMIVRREQARARIIALRRERAQVAHRMEQARSVLEHQRSLPEEFPPDPNLEVEADEAP